MTAEPLRPADDPEPEEVDLDLDLLDEALKAEAVGKPVTVRIGGLVVHVTHAND